MFGLADILVLVVYRFYDGPFSQKYLVPNFHQHILHIVHGAGYQVHAPIEGHFQ